MPAHEVQVGMAQAGGGHLDPHLVMTGITQLHLFDLQILAEFP